MRKGIVAGVVAVAAVVLSAALTGLDVLVEGARPELAELAVDFVDRLLMLAAVGVIAVLAMRVGGLSNETGALRRDLDHVSAAAAGWRRRSRRLLDGLSEAVDGQFRDWGLTPAEADIAGLMLKGLPLGDIAVLRRTSEATIRQQAQGIYRKSGLANRAELSAYFLEDLFTVAEGALAAAAPDATPGHKPN